MEIYWNFYVPTVEIRIIISSVYNVQYCVHGYYNFFPPNQRNLLKCNNLELSYFCSLGLRVLLYILLSQFDTYSNFILASPRS
jgi:hypothetical protein